MLLKEKLPLLATAEGGLNVLSGKAHRRGQALNFPWSLTDKKYEVAFIHDCMEDKKYIIIPMDGKFPIRAEQVRYHCNKVEKARYPCFYRYCNQKIQEY